MDRIIDILLGLLAGYLLARVFAAKPDAAAAAVNATTPATALATGAAETLSARLHRLEPAISAFGQSAAHPRELAELHEFRQAEALFTAPGTPIASVQDYALGSNWALASAALSALAMRPDSAAIASTIAASFDQLAPWSMHFALDVLTGSNPRPPAGDILLGAKDWWAENPFVQNVVRDYFERRAAMGDAAEFGPELARAQAPAVAAMKAFADSIRHPFAVTLKAKLDGVTGPAAPADPAFLASFGRMWGEADDKAILVEPAEWDEALKASHAGLRAGRARSLLVTGDALVGKSSFLRLLARRIAADGWRVFEAGSADLMAGQQWFGQLEERIRRTLAEASADKKLIWYIPDLLQIALSGTHQGQNASILDQILPAIAAGRLIVWSEATPASAVRLYQRRPRLRGLTELAAIEPMGEAETATLAASVADRLARSRGVTIDAASVPTAIASARQYMSTGGFPGSVIALIRVAVGSAEAGSRVGPGRILDTLAQLTGLPVSILDHHGRIDIAEIRSFFTQRVIGQDEAVAAIVERIAMLKAGLSDPGKPIGVFLFAGPTGTGKTELAKTTAEYLFSSADRLIRLDMSEFQNPETQSKILGDPQSSADTDSLISRVRKQPFSVILLDEFEKANPRIWDLFLQVFDEGRLTDAAGHEADFRHAMIIMTSNLGATVHRDSGLGFAPGGSAFTGDQVLRAIAQTYRPEFVNRIDKVIVFRPLSRELMRGILKKELEVVLERRGIRNRTWAVEWESSAQEFLLEKGFSPEMGARPLKRAIDQYLLAPLAQTIVEQRFPEGDQFVFVRSDGRAIQAEFVDPDTDAPYRPEPVNGAAGPRAVSLAGMILAPDGTRAEALALAEASRAIDARLAAPDWETLKSELAEAMATTGFWTRDDRHATLARLALMDRVAAAAGTARSLGERLARAKSGAGGHSRELVTRLALQVHLVEDGIRDVFAAAPVEAALWIEPALETGGGDGEAVLAWCRDLLAMYRAWANRRHMQVEEVAGGRPRGLPVLLVAGFGAHRTLAREAGLHIFERGDGSGAAGRLTARVLIATPPLGPVPAGKQYGNLAALLARTARGNDVTRRYRREPSPLVRSAGWRSGRLDAVLAGDFDLIGAEG